MAEIKPGMKTPNPLPRGSITLGELPAGCTYLGMETALVRGHFFLVVLTDVGPFICEPGKSKLTKLEPLDG